MVDAYGFRTEPPKRGVPYCKDSSRSTLPMQAKSCSDGCKRLWMSGVLLKNLAPGAAALAAFGRGRHPVVAPAFFGGPATARLREMGYCRPAVEGRRPVRAPPVRVSPSATRPAPLRSADDRTFRLRPEPVRTCSAPSRPAPPRAMRRSAAAPRVRRCPIRRCAA